MCWTAVKYAQVVVVRYRLMLLGWPEDIAFADLNRVLGGVSTLRRLQWLWDNKILRFEEASEEDVENALRDPTLVLPGTPRARPPVAPSDPVESGVTGLVHHPANMNPVFLFGVNAPLRADWASSPAKARWRTARRMAVPIPAP